MKYIFSFLLVLGLYTITKAQTNFGNSVGTQGTSHSFFGERAGQVNTGSFNSFFGHWAGRSNTIGYENDFLGALTGLDNTGGHHNVFAGFSAGDTTVMSCGASNALTTF